MSWRIFGCLWIFALVTFTSVTAEERPRPAEPPTLERVRRDALKALVSLLRKNRYLYGDEGEKERAKFYMLSTELTRFVQKRIGVQQLVDRRMRRSRTAVVCSVRRRSIG